MIVGRVEDVMTDDALSGAFACRVERVDASGLIGIRRAMKIARKDAAGRGAVAAVARGVARLVLCHGTIRRGGRSPSLTIPAPL